MFAKTSLTFAALLVAGTTLAHAEAMTHDANTGLEARYYYDTLANLDRQGLPISARAKTYLQQHGGSQATVGQRGNVFLLEDRPRVYGAEPSYTGTYGSNANDVQRPW